MGYQVPTALSKRNTISKWSASSNLGDVVITQFDAEGKALETWTLWNGFLTELSFSNLEYGSDELSEVTVKFRYDWAQVEIPDSSGTGQIFFD